MSDDEWLMFSSLDSTPSDDDDEVAVPAPERLTLLLYVLPAPPLDGVGGNSPVASDKEDGFKNVTTAVEYYESLKMPPVDELAVLVDLTVVDLHVDHQGVLVDPDDQWPDTPLSLASLEYMEQGAIMEAIWRQATANPKPVEPPKSRNTTLWGLLGVILIQAMVICWWVPLAPWAAQVAIPPPPPPPPQLTPRWAEMVAFMDQLIYEYPPVRGKPPINRLHRCCTDACRRTSENAVSVYHHVDVFDWNQLYHAGAYEVTKLYSQVKEAVNWKQLYEDAGHSAAEMVHHIKTGSRRVSEEIILAVNYTEIVVTKALKDVSKYAHEKYNIYRPVAKCWGQLALLGAETITTLVIEDTTIMVEDTVTLSRDVFKGVYRKCQRLKRQYRRKINQMTPTDSWRRTRAMFLLMRQEARISWKIMKKKAQLYFSEEETEARRKHYERERARLILDVVYGAQEVVNLFGKCRRVRV